MKVSGLKISTLDFLRLRPQYCTTVQLYNIHIKYLLGLPGAYWLRYFPGRLSPQPGMGKFRCEVCDQELKDKSKLERHVQSLHREILYSCEMCNFQTRSEASFKLHTQSHDPGKKRIFCTDCPKHFACQSNLKKHVRSVHQMVRLKCSQCPYEATDGGSLKRHKLSLHLGVKYDCKICGKEFTFKENLRHHNLAVHRQRKFRCKECDYSATTNGALKNHSHL